MLLWEVKNGSDNLTPLQGAVLGSKNNINTVRILLKRYVEVDINNETKITDIEFALEFGLKAGVTDKLNNEKGQKYYELVEILEQNFMLLKIWSLKFCEHCAYVEWL